MPMHASGNAPRVLPLSSTCKVNAHKMHGNLCEVASQNYMRRSACAR